MSRCMRGVVGMWHLRVELLKVGRTKAPELAVNQSANMGLCFCTLEAQNDLIGAHQVASDAFCPPRESGFFCGGLLGHYAVSR
jgi:hypothetical protein